MILVAGTKKVAFTTGVSLCKERNAYLPFFAFADNDAVEAEMGLLEAPVQSLAGAEDVQRTVDVFSRHGTVIFLDNPVTVERMMSMIDGVLDFASATDWYSRTPSPVRKN